MRGERLPTSGQKEEEEEVESSSHTLGKILAALAVEPSCLTVK